VEEERNAFISRLGASFDQKSVISNATIIEREFYSFIRQKLERSFPAWLFGASPKPMLQ